MRDLALGCLFWSPFALTWSAVRRRNVRKRSPTTKTTRARSTKLVANELRQALADLGGVA